MSMPRVPYHSARFRCELGNNAAHTASTAQPSPPIPLPFVTAVPKAPLKPRSSSSLLAVFTGHSRLFDRSRVVCPMALSGT